MSKKIFLEISAQEMLFILESLSLYKDIILPDNYKDLINNLLSTINQQLQLQGINLYVNKEQTNLIGKSCIINDVNINDLSTNKLQGIIIGSSDIANLIKVVVNKNNALTVIDVPLNLIEKVDI